LRADLTANELRLIDWLLPSDRKFYAGVRETIMALPRSHDPDAVYFGEYDDEIAETMAIGKAESEGRKYPVLLRLNDDRTGAMLTLPEGETPSLVWALSGWLPGTQLGQDLREIPLFASDRQPIYTLALSPSERVLWLHHRDSQYNQLIPVTGMLIELARLTGPSRAEHISSDAFFDLAKAASDNKLVGALLEYNKKAKKFDASRIIVSEEPRRSGFLDLVPRRR
jgi:hypothetical protein